LVSREFTRRGHESSALECTRRIAKDLGDEQAHDAFERVSVDNLRDMITQADGGIYNLPKYTEQVGNMHSQRQWINQAWLDKLDLKMPTTTEEFLEVLRAFRDNDPNGNGLRDEIPYIGSLGWQSSSIDALMNAFIYNDSSAPNNKPRWLIKDGILDTPYTKEEWRDGLRFAKQLVDEGLLSPLCFTQDVTQLMQLLASETMQVGVYTAGANLFGATDVRKLDFAPLPPLTGPKGVCYTAFIPSVAGAGFVITKYCEHPEAAFRLGDYCMSRDIAFRNRFGVPEIDWREPGPDDKGLYEDMGFPAQVVPILPFNSVQNSYWGGNLDVVMELGIQDGQAISDDDPLYTERFIAQAVPYYVGKTPKEYVDLIKYNLEENDEIKDIYSTLVTYVNESMARFVTGDMDLDTQWESYLKELNNIGLPHFVEISQRAYDRTH
jgi:putative aldouronate transport system substrate-binding protein